MYFAKLDDSPMFRQQIQLLEDSAETLRERSLKFHKGCRKYIDGLGEAYDREVAFASSLETFSGRHTDPISVSYGGPDMAKFSSALREIATYKDILQSQVDYAVIDKLLNFANVDVQDVKEARKRFDKASYTYDQAREKYLSLRKSTRLDIASSVEEELRSARSTFEQTRFSLVGALSAVEAKKRFEFLEAVGNTMSAHLRYFRQGFELLHQMEPYINQVLAYAQQARQQSIYEQSALNERMQEYRRQVDLESRVSLNLFGSPNRDIIQPYLRNSHKSIETVMNSAAEGKIQTIKEGYLLKRSSNLRGDWKRRFFVLDNRGKLYYYRNKWSKFTFNGSSNQLPVHRTSPAEQGSGLLSRWLSSHYHGSVQDEKSEARHTVNLLTSTIKLDEEELDLRFCFRIISPTKNYTLQAECATDQVDWIQKINGVITSLLSSQAPERVFSSSVSEGSSDGSTGHDSWIVKEDTSEKDISSIMRMNRNSMKLKNSSKTAKPVDALKRLPGNDKCADCGAPEPDWASLNLGVLICIECSGIHRKLGVHISKVRSLALDVKVWEPSVLNMFLALGNVFVNSIWEGLLRASRTVQADEIPIRSLESNKYRQFYSKPSPGDHITDKEKFIQAKYAEKRFIHRSQHSEHLLSIAEKLWESVSVNDKKAVYCLIITWEADVNAILGHASPVTCLTLANVMSLHKQMNPDQNFDGADSPTALNIPEDDSLFVDWLSDGCSLLHLACQTADIGMVELLLQHGANINICDLRGHTPLHHSIMRGRPEIAKLLLARGADPEAVDEEGRTPSQLVTDSAIDDVELFALLNNGKRQYYSQNSSCDLYHVSSKRS